MLNELYVWSFGQDFSCIWVLPNFKICDEEIKTFPFQVTTDENAESGGRLGFRGAATDLRARQDDLFTEGNWNHLCVVLNKSVVRKSTASIYVNGICVVSTSKVLVHIFVFFCVRKY